MNDTVITSCAGGLRKIRTSLVARATSLEDGIMDASLPVFDSIIEFLDQHVSWYDRLDLEHMRNNMYREEGMENRWTPEK